ncbi:hypothetical protein ABWK96_004625 [Vibrio parahaemolyticus]|nr:hypothetical protein [Vibrio parahaemolyticus]EIA1350080.1 hypothetical protein [Vibrio parahaemolyticus]EJE4537696.1 hypothetical protein [Vibrio parahaemolyticus]
MEDIERVKIEKWPTFYLNKSWVKALMQRYVSLAASIIIMYYSYFYACMFGNAAIFSGSGSIVSIIGLLLTLKHNFISDASNPHAAFHKYHKKMGSFNSIGQMEDASKVNPVIRAIKDEYMGVALLVLGGLVSGYGSLVCLV